MALYMLYHANCPDGFGAAYAAWKRYGNSAEYVPMSHGEEPPKMLPQSQVYIMDYAFKRPLLLELAQTHTLKVLDHHRTAAEDLEGLPFAEFDMSRSGAVMAWQHFHPKIEVPELLLYVQDQDLWNWDLPDSHAICAGLGLYPFDFEVWDNLKIEDLRREGEVILRYREQLLKQLQRKIDWVEICGKKVPAVNTPLFASELGNQLCLLYPQAPFSACYAEHHGQRKFSLRSIGDSDVAKVAQYFGGGGHRNAAGFAIPASGHPAIKWD